MKKINFVKVCTAVITAALVFLSCDQPPLLTNQGKMGKLTVNVKVSGAPQAKAAENILLTVFPTIPENTFTKYVLSFDRAGGANPVDAEISGATDTVTLPVDTYNITCTGYSAAGPIAVGTVPGIVVTEGGGSADIMLGPKTDGASGTFAYTITLGAGVTSLEDGSILYITGASDTSHIDINGGETGTDIDLTGAGNLSKSITLDPGFYRVWLYLKKDGSEAKLPGETIHVYSGLTSTFTHTFTAENFGTVAVIDDLELKNYFAYPVLNQTPATVLTGLPALKQYTGTIAWTLTTGGALAGAFAGETAYTAAVTLTAASGYTFTEVAANSFSYTDTEHVVSVSNAAGDGAGLSLTVTVNFTATDVTQGALALTLGLGLDEMTVTGYTAPLTLAVNAAVVPWSVSGYNDVTWIVDGDGPQTANSFTLNPANYSVKKHTAVVSGTKNNKPYSRILEFTITAAAGGGQTPEEEQPEAEPEPETLTLAQVSAYLAGKPENTADTPYILKFDATVTGNTGYTGQTLAFANKLKTYLDNNKTKFVALDLSLMTFSYSVKYASGTQETNKVIGGDVSGSPQPGDFNYLKTCTNLVGVILPEGQKANGAFYGMTNLKWVVIPSTVTGITLYSFYGCSNLKKITIYKSGTMSSSDWDGYIFPSTTALLTTAGSFYYVYRTTNNYAAGVYTYDDTAGVWTRSELPD
ncbi:MAG: leucine-rich repeat domain-containing protein [Spirochaetaceae bacterium]|jgi:hypothetical protein|nr:leucine-rich repeat domain-containing protein [Spirochaetaceae bacterium]